MRALVGLSYSPPRPDDIPAMDRVLEQALTFPVGSMATWTQQIGHPQMRVVRQGERVVAGLGVIPFGHWFGGRVVPAGGVTAVGVAPDRRGSGLGLWMLRQMLEEQHALGVPLLSLYPATTAFYRRAGFERAAHRLIYELPLAAIGLRDYQLDVAPIEGAQVDLLKGLYTRRAASAAAFIERPDFFWQRMLTPSDKPSSIFVALRDGVPEGYVVFLHASWGEALQVRDMVALTPAAGRRLLTVLADHRSILDTVRLPAGPHDPLLFLMPEQKQSVFRSLDLMIRILDLPASLAARGYPPDLAAELHLEVTDELLPWNHGRFVLRVADGLGQVERGGQGRLRLHIRDLVTLYSGYFTPQELLQASEVEADAASLASAAQIFAGPRPWLPDMF
jgi:predicted acetyltransferase